MRHVAFVKSKVKRSLPQLLEELKLSDADDEQSIIDLRRGLFASSDGRVSVEVVRCYVQTTSSEGLAQVGWVLNESAPACLVCAGLFGLRHWRHHCRGCGIIMCGNCQFTAPSIEGFPSLDWAPVCSFCFIDKDKEIRILRNNTFGESLEKPSQQIQIQQAQTQLTQGPPSEPVPPDELVVTPLPGYVIKTRRTTGQKVFINVYHHESVQDFSMSLPLTALPTEPDPHHIPIFYFAAPQEEPYEDFTVYNVLVSSQYFASTETRIIESICVQKLIECLNKFFGDTMLEEEYVRPRIKSGCKGQQLLQPSTFLLNLQKASCYSRISVRSDNRSVSSRSQRTGQRRESFPDDASIASEMTQQSSSSVSHDPARFLGRGKAGSFFGMVQEKRRDGRALLQPALLLVRDEQRVSVQEATALLKQAALKPAALLGWLISLELIAPAIADDPELDQRLYVITAMAKNRARQTEYRLSCLERDDLWVRLRRGDAKHGLGFRPLRKVLLDLNK